MSDDAVVCMRATATHFYRQPFMYNPNLPRWLCRIGPDARAVGRQRPRGDTRLRPRLRQTDFRRTLRTDRAGRPSSGDRAARRIRGTVSELRSPPTSDAKPATLLVIPAKAGIQSCRPPRSRGDGDLSHASAPAPECHRHGTEAGDLQTPMAHHQSCPTPAPRRASEEAAGGTHLLRRYATELDADAIAVQEVDGPAITASVFPPDNPHSAEPRPRGPARRHRGAAWPSLRRQSRPDRPRRGPGPPIAQRRRRYAATAAAAARARRSSEDRLPRCASQQHHAPLLHRIARAVVTAARLD